jgi:hypothetical protein
VNGAAAEGTFAAGAWYILVRISFCCVFDLSTQELQMAKKAKKKKAKKKK